MGESGMKKYKGVRIKKEQWVAEIRPPRGEKCWLGTFSTQDEAAYAYDAASTIFDCNESCPNFGWHMMYEKIPKISTELRRELRKDDYDAEVRRLAKKYGKLAMEFRGELSMDVLEREFPVTVGRWAAEFEARTTAAAASTSNAGETTTSVPTWQAEPHPGIYAQDHPYLYQQ